MNQFLDKSHFLFVFLFLWRFLCIEWRMLETIRNQIHPVEVVSLLFNRILIHWNVMASEHFFLNCTNLRENHLLFVDKTSPQKLLYFESQYDKISIVLALFSLLLYYLEIIFPLSPAKCWLINFLMSFIFTLSYQYDHLL